LASRTCIPGASGQLSLKTSAIFSQASEIERKSEWCRLAREKSENPEAMRAPLAEQTNKITALFTATLLEPLHTLCVYVCGGALACYACSKLSLKSFSAS